MRGSVEAVEQITSSLSNLIPQLFFDMIARFLPGLVAIFSFNFVFNDIIGKLKSVHNYPYLKYVVFVIACYYISIILYGLWCASEFMLSQLLPENIKDKLKDYILPQGSESSVSNEQFSLRYDFIKLRAPSAGNRITKLKAEVHMSCELTMTFFLCFIASIFRCDIFILFFFISSIGAFFSYKYFSERLWRAVGSYSTLIGYEKFLYELPDEFKIKK
jgi:hypothetical protein